MRKCIECGESFIDGDTCPYCGSDDIIELEQIRRTSNQAYIDAVFNDEPSY